jgi:hypothetical protein
MSDDHRELRPEEIEALRQKAAEMQQVLRQQMAPLVEAMRKASDSQIAGFGEAARALADTATSPALEMVRQATEHLSQMRLPVIENQEQIKPEFITPLQASKPPEFYVVDALYDAVAAIEGTSDLLKESLEVQRRQVDEIAQTRRSVDDQTRLTRWVLAVAIATLVASAVGVAATVLVTLFVVQ